MSGPERKTLHGRRKGHKLRPGQARLMEELLPRLRVDTGSGAPVDPAGWFVPRSREVWLEIGFGGGEHLAWQAVRNPDVALIGCEPFVNGIASLLAQVDRLGLANIRIHDGDARDLLDRLAPATLARVFLLFPDPWPKRRHHKRRFVEPENLDRLAHAMAPGAELRIASDIADYVRWTLLHALAHDAFDWCAETAADWRRRPVDWPPTRYERKAIDAGRVPTYLKFIRRA